jgi:hypothetical protein
MIGKHIVRVSQCPNGRLQSLKQRLTSIVVTEVPLCGMVAL